MYSGLKNMSKGKKGALFAALALLFLFILLAAFSKVFVEGVLHASGQPKAKIGAIDYSLNGTVLTNIELPDAGIHIDRATLYATPADIAAARLAKVDIDGLHWQAPVTAKTSPSSMPDVAQILRQISGLNLHANEISIARGSALLSPDVTVNFEGGIVDSGESYDINIALHSAAPVPAEAALTGHVWHGSRRMTLDFTLADLAYETAGVVVKRASGGTSLQVENDGTYSTTSQYTAGALRLAGVPLTDTVFDLQGDLRNFHLLAQGRLPAQGKTAADNAVYAEITQKTQSDTATLTLKASAATSGLETLGIDGLSGRAQMEADLQASRPAAAGITDLAQYGAATGKLDLSAKGLSLGDVLQKADAAAALRLTLDPATRQISLSADPKVPLTLKMHRKDGDWSLAAPDIAADYKQQQNTLALRWAGASAGLPQLNVTDLQGDVTLGLADPIAAEGKITAVLASPQKPALFTPLKAELQLASLSSQQGATGVTATLTGQDGALMVKANGRYDAAAQSATFQAELVPVDMKPGVWQLSDFFPVSENYVTDVSGRIGARARGSWAKGRLSASGGILVKGVNATYSGFPVSDINTVVHFDSLVPPSFQKQTISVGAFTAGLPLQNGVIVASLDKKGVARLDDGRMSMAGGQVFVTPFSLDLDKRQADIVLNAANLDLAQLFAIAPMEGLSATGKVEGRLPLKLDGDKITLVDGLLKSQGEGVIKYSPRTLPTFLADDTNAGIVTLRTALANFNYSSLQMGLSGDLLKEQKIALTVEGKNPDFYSGHPVKLNLNVEGPLQNILKYAPGGSNIPDAIQKQIEQFEDDPNAAPH